MYAVRGYAVETGPASILFHLRRSATSENETTVRPSMVSAWRKSSTRPSMVPSPLVGGASWITKPGACLEESLGITGPEITALGHQPDKTFLSRRPALPEIRPGAQHFEKLVVPDNQCVLLVEDRNGVIDAFNRGAQQAGIFEKRDLTRLQFRNIGVDRRPGRRPGCGIPGCSASARPADGFRTSLRFCFCRASRRSIPVPLPFPSISRFKPWADMSLSTVSKHDPITREVPDYRERRFPGKSRFHHGQPIVFTIDRQRRRHGCPVFRPSGARPPPARMRSASAVRLPTRHLDQVHDGIGQCRRPAPIGP